MKTGLSVAVQASGQGYITLGTSHRFGVVPQDIKYKHDASEFGCLDASFVLKLNPKYPHNDIEFFTPVVVFDGAVPVWSGRVISAPSMKDIEGTVTVNCHGWGQHTKDYPVDILWLSNSMADFNSMADHPDVSLTDFEPFGGSVGVEGSSLLFTIPTGSSIPASAKLATFFDCGPNNEPAEIVIGGVETSASSSAAVQYVKVGVMSALDGTLTEVGSFDMATASHAAQTFSVSASSDDPYRYVIIYFSRGASVGSSTPTHWARVNNVLVAGKSASVASNVSALLASDVISDTLAAACPAFSANHDGIEATAFTIPQYPPQAGRKYPNEVIAAVNAYHGHRFVLSCDPVPVPRFSPVPTKPFFELGIGDDYSLSNTSNNDGREVYSSIIMQFDLPGGERGEVIVDQPEITRYENAVEALTNGSFAVDLDEWQQVYATRDTGTYFSSPASMKIAYNGVAWRTLEGLKTGGQYELTFRARRETGSTTYLSPNTAIYGGASGGIKLGGIDDRTLTTSWAEYTISFVASSTVCNLQIPTTGFAYFVDDFALRRVIHNAALLNNQPRAKLVTLKGRSTETAAAAIGQLMLNASQYPALNGQVVVSGRVPTSQGNSSMSASIAAQYVGELLLLKDEQSPNSGALGRAGFISKSSYEEAANRVTFDIDTPNDYIDRLLARF